MLNVSNTVFACAFMRAASLAAVALISVTTSTAGCSSNTDAAPAGGSHSGGSAGAAAGGSGGGASGAQDKAGSGGATTAGNSSGGAAGSNSGSGGDHAGASGSNSGAPGSFAGSSGASGSAPSAGAGGGGPVDPVLEQACAAQCSMQKTLACVETPCQDTCIARASKNALLSSCKAEYKAMLQCTSALMPAQWLCSADDGKAVPVVGKCTTTACAWTCCVTDLYAPSDLLARCNCP